MPVQQSPTPPFEGESVQVYAVPAELDLRHYRLVVLFTGQRRNAVPPLAPFVEGLWTMLARLGDLVSVQGRLYLRVDGRWLAVPVSPAAALPLLCHGIAMFRCSTLPTPDCWAWNYRASSDRPTDLTPAGELNLLKRCLPEGCEARLEMWHQTTERWCSAFTTQADRRGIPLVQGILRHPLVAAPAVPDRWICPPPPPVPKQVHKAEHLHRLFAPLNLRPEAHATLYGWLFGALHYSSLSRPRPILCIDSRSRGAGKSEISRALQWILDRTDSPIALPRGAGTGRDQDCLAGMLADNRCVVVNNLDGDYELHNQFLINLSTDGAPSINRKYDRDNTAFEGRLAVVNGAYGAFGLSEDLLERIWRVELAYEPSKALGVIEYAKDHRDAILAEAFFFTGIEGEGDGQLEKQTRLGPYEIVAGIAYSYFMNLEFGETEALFRTMWERRYALHKDSIFSLAREKPTVFEGPGRELPDINALCGRKPGTPRLGSAAMGYVYGPEGWKEEPDV